MSDKNLEDDQAHDEASIKHSPGNGLTPSATSLKSKPLFDDQRGRMESFLVRDDHDDQENVSTRSTQTAGTPSSVFAATAVKRTESTTRIFTKKKTLQCDTHLFPGNGPTPFASPPTSKPLSDDQRGRRESFLARLDEANRLKPTADPISSVHMASAVRRAESTTLTFENKKTLQSDTHPKLHFHMGLQSLKDILMAADINHAEAKPSNKERRRKPTEDDIEPLHNYCNLLERRPCHSTP
jgi:hypothetical protein